MTQREENQAAYRRLCTEIDESYPKGRFVAIDGGKVVADAASFNEVDQRLNEMGLTSPHVLVVEAGVEYPEHVTIFL